MIDASAEQIKPKGIGDEIAALVIQDIESRAQLGERMYGERLRAFNGRNSLLDAYQEALDQCMYLRQTLEEQRAHGMFHIDPAFYRLSTTRKVEALVAMRLSIENLWKDVFDKMRTTENTAAD